MNSSRGTVEDDEKDLVVDNASPLPASPEKDPMNAHANDVLSNIRKTLQTELEGSNVQDANLTEAQQQFISEATALATKLDLELEGFEGASADEVRDALVAVLDELSEAEASQMEALLSKYFES